MPFSANTIRGASVHTENIWSRLWNAIGGKQEGPAPKAAVATDGYEAVNRAADPHNPQAMIAVGASGGATRLAVANEHQALARVIEHLTVHPGGFGVMSRYLSGMTPADLEKSCFLEYLHDLDNEYVIFLKDPPGVVTCGMELSLDKKSGRFTGIYNLDLYHRRISHNKAPV